MSLKRILAASAALACTFCVTTPALAGYPSLDTENRMDDITATVDGVTTRFTVIQDANVASQWYYVPDRPRVAKRTYGGKEVPEFSLVKYQTAEPGVEAGILQLSFSLAIPAEAIEQIRSAVAARMNQQQVTVASLPIKSAEVFLFDSGTGALVSKGVTNKDGLAPSFATQSIGVQLELSRIGADVFNALTTETTGGIGVGISFTYQGLSPKLGCEATVKWEEAHKYFGRNQKFAVEVGYLGVFGAKGEGDLTKVREKLTQDGIIQMKSITGEGLTQEQCDKIAFQPLLARLATALLKLQAADPTAAAATARDVVAEKGKPDEKDKKSGGFWSKAFGTASYSTKQVDIERVRTYSEKILFTTRQVLDSRTVVSGFVGIGEYPEDVRKGAVLTVSERPWDRVLVMLPTVPLDYDIRSVDLTIKPKLDTFIEAQQYRWSQDKGWVNWSNKEAFVAYFPLADLELTDDQKRAMPLNVTYTVARRGQAISTEGEVPADQQSNIVNNLMQGIERVVVSDVGVTWSKLKPNEGVAYVAVTLTTPTDSKSFQFHPRNENGVWNVPADYVWLVKKGEPVSAKVNFRLASGKEVAWEHSGKNLRNTADGLFIGLMDASWQR